MAEPKRHMYVPQGACFGKAPQIQSTAEAHKKGHEYRALG